MRGAGEKRSRRGVEKETCGVEASPWESIGIATGIGGSKLISFGKMKSNERQTDKQPNSKQKQDFDLVCGLKIKTILKSQNSADKLYIGIKN